MNSSIQSRSASLALSCAALLVLTACGGGGDGASAASSASLAVAADEGAASVRALASNSAGAIVLVSSNTAGAARGGITGALEGSTCGLSADGSVVVFDSASNSLVAGDTNSRSDTYVKNTRTGVTTRVSSGSEGSGCVAITPDGRSVLFRTGYDSTSALFVKNLVNGSVTKVTPAVNSIAENTGFIGGAISDDGNKVLFRTIPTQNYVGQYDFVNRVPSRLMIRDLRDNSLVTVATDDGVVAHGEVIYGGAISPDGNKVAFVATGVLAPGDTNGQPDVYVRDLVSGATTLASSTSAGVPAVITYCCNAQYGNPRFVNNNMVQFLAAQPSNLGPRGDYLKNLGNGQTSLLLADVDGSTATVSGDGNKMAFSRIVSGGNFTYRAVLRDLRTGAEQIVSTTRTGVIGNGSVPTVQISRDGNSVAFTSNATNLVSPATPGNNTFQVYLKTVAASPL